MFKLTIEVSDASELLKIASLLNGEGVEVAGEAKAPAAKKKAKTAAEKKAEKEKEASALPVQSTEALAPSAPVDLKVPVTPAPTPAAENPMNFINSFNQAPAAPETPALPAKEVVIQSIQAAIAKAGSLSPEVQGEVVGSCIAAAGIPQGVKLTDVQDVTLLMKFDTALRNDLVSKGITL